MDGLYLPRMVFPEYQDQIRSGVGKKIKVGILDFLLNFRKSRADCYMFLETA